MSDDPIKEAKKFWKVDRKKRHDASKELENDAFSNVEKVFPKPTGMRKPENSTPRPEAKNFVKPGANNGNFSRKLFDGGKGGRKRRHKRKTRRKRRQKKRTKKMRKSRRKSRRRKRTKRRR